MAPTEEEDAAASAMARLEVTNGADDAAAAGDDDGDASGDDDVADDPAGAPSAAAKKKKKKKKKKKTGGGGAGRRRGLGRRGPDRAPSVPVSKLFNGTYPEGEIQRYKDDNLWRETNEEKRELERLERNMYNEVRQCAEVHREVSKYIADWVKPG